MKNSHKVILGVMMVFVAFSSTARAEYKEGKWSMTMVTKMENMSPEMAAAIKQMENMPPEQKAMMEQMQAKMGVSMRTNGEGMTINATECLTKKNPVPSKMSEQSGCEQTHEFNGNTVNFHVTCNRNNFQMESTGIMTYSGDTMQGQIKSHQVRNGHTADSTIDITGQYLGPCS